MYTDKRDTVDCMAILNVRYSCLDLVVYNGKLARKKSHQYTMYTSIILTGTRMHRNSKGGAQQVHAYITWQLLRSPTG